MPLTKQFDPVQALDQAMRVFWTKGYDGTSIADLLAVMGIHKGSFYDTFGSKHDLLLKAIDRYTSERFESFEHAIAGLGPRESILTVFDFVVKECVGSDRSRGCFSLNCALELAPSDPQVRRKVQQSFRYHENMMAELIARGQDDGVIPEHIDPQDTSKVLMGLIMAMRVYGKTGAPRSTFLALRRQAAAVIGAAD